MPIDLSRRDLLRLGLVTAAATGLAACTTASNGSPAPTDPGGPEDPDRALRAEIGREETRLIALYAAAAGVLTGAVAQRVAVVGARHEAYRQAIDPDRLATDAAVTITSASTGATGAPVPSALPALPTMTATTAVSVLAAEETAAAAARAAQSATAVDVSLARVVVLAGAGAASAAAVLAGRPR